ncbi:MAG: invasion associated locus B family protein [Janthinobacterium lividum]
MRHAAGASMLFALLAMPALVGPSRAETAKPGAAPAPVTADPSVTTATYGDWIARCEQGTGDQSQRICEAVQTVQLPNQQAAAAQIAFGHSASKDPLKLVVVVPVDVWFPSTVKVSAGDKDTNPIELPWRRCLPVGCFAESASSDDAAKRWHGESGQGRIVYRNGLNRDVTLPVSFRGLAQALDALAKQ